MLTEKLRVLEQPHPIVVAFSEINLIMHEVAQRRILEDIGIPNAIDSNIDFYDSHLQTNTSQLPEIVEESHRESSRFNWPSERVPMKETLQELQRNHLTKWIGLKPIEAHPNEIHAYSVTPHVAPLSIAKNLIKPKEKLVSPCYFSDDFVRQKYNSSKYMPHEEVLANIFKLNEKKELVIIDKKVLESQKGILADVFKQATYLLLTGQGMVKMSLPIRIFEPKSQTERLGEFFTNFDSLHKAADSEPGIEMLKHVIGYFCGNYLYGVDTKKPFNPYIGETLQAHFTEGTKLFIEHVHHDPPIDQLLFVNDTKKFRISCALETAPNMSSNELKLKFKGVIEVDLAGEKLYCTLPTVSNKGLVVGTRRIALEDCLYFHYPSKKLKAYVKFGNDKRADALEGGIFHSNETLVKNHDGFGPNLFPSLKPKKMATEQLLCKIEGSWMEHVELDGVKYWTKDQKGYKMQMDEDVLPSDWRFREDLIWLTYGQSVYAQEWKLKLEGVLRDFRKARETYAKAKKKANK